MKWNYSSSLDSATGYEQDMDYLTKYSDKEEFRKLPEQEQKEIIKEYMEFYRDKNIFPITYFNDKGIEILRKIKEKSGKAVLSRIWVNR